MATKEWHAVDLSYTQKNGQIRIFDPQGRHVANVLASQKDAGKTAARMCRALILYDEQFPNNDPEEPSR